METDVRSLRGSRKHVLDWTARREFVVELLQMIAPVDACISRESTWMPRGYRSPDEARLESFGPEVLPEHRAWKILRDWWLAHERGANTPNWDIAVGCDIAGSPGLVLVEAKANVPELGQGGKLVGSDASASSQENHRRIGQAIDEACAALRRISDATAISRDSHYQLSNRLAFAWKLASLGIPTVLVYLGFIGDDGIRDVGQPFRDDSHWRRVFADYIRPVAPQELFERRLECGAAPAWFLVRSRPVLSTSPQRQPEN